MNFSDLNIILISSSDKPLDAMSQESQDAAEKYLVQLGVNFMKNERVTDYDGEVIYMKSGNSIPTNNVIWAAGVTGNIIDDFNKENLVRNRYIVDRYNKVKGFDNIFAIGDIAYMETPKYPQAHPQLANVAINQGKNLARNFKRIRKKTGQNTNTSTVDRWLQLANTARLLTFRNLNFRDFLLGISGCSYI